MKEILQEALRVLSTIQDNTSTKEQVEESMALIELALRKQRETDILLKIAYSMNNILIKLNDNGTE